MDSIFDAIHGLRTLGDTEWEGYLRFWSTQGLDSFLAESAIPAKFAEEAVRLFFASGRRPTNIEWEADW